MKNIFITIVTLLSCVYVHAQQPTFSPYLDAPAVATNIIQYAFYIDTVKATKEQAFTFGATNNNTTTPPAILLTGVTSGVHQLYAKVVTTDGKPSIMNLGNFYMEGDNFYQNTPSAATDIIQYSFYIDTVKATKEQAFTFGTTNNNTTTPPPILLTGVTSGVHQLYAKVIAVDGKPSIINLGNFYMEGDNLYQNTPAAATAINQYSFYVDTVKASKEQAFTFGNTSNNTTPPPAILLAGVTSGVHQLYAKVLATDGKPSIMNLGNFYMEGDNLYQNIPTAAPQITRYEFYIDSVRTTNKQPLSFGPFATDVTSNTPISLALVQPGTHQLYARVFDVNNIPSIVNLGNFTMEQIYRYQNAATAAAPIANMEYFVDTDPGYGLATPIVVSGTNVNEVLSSISVTIPNTLPAGVHYFHIRSKQNPWSIDNVIPFTTTGVVPVTWLYVRAQILNAQTIVSWATAQETNTSKFEIEHSMNGVTFVKLGQQQVAGNSSTVSNYIFTHTKPVTGFNYYRIKQIDTDGSFKYSVIVKVINNENIKQTIIAPNPVVDVLNIVEPTSIFINSIEVYDAKGLSVIRKTINEETQVYSLPVMHLPKANYMLKINYKNETKTIPFVK
jgi:cytochrome b involved in lipid metabolism